MPDAPEPMRRCDPNAEFGPPVLVTGLATAGTERTAQLSSDELTVYFSGVVGASTTYDIYEARRDGRTSPFGPAQPVAVSSSSQDFAPSISADGTTLVFASNRLGENNGNDYRIFVATRASALVEFSASAAPLAGIGISGVSDSQPSLSGDGQEIWFVSNRGGASIWRAMRTISGVATPQGAPELDPASFPTISTDRLVIYFASPRAAPGTKGMNDIWFSHRNSVTEPFPPPALVPNINSASQDEPTWLSIDNCRLYIESDRSGTWDIYVASRQP